jgi:sugar phosphate isomerase/epimerase
MLSITTDYQSSQGDPLPSLRAIAEAGFTHIHWCHQWNTDFIYHPSEIKQIAQWLRDLGLTLADTHGSEGKEKFWYSPQEYARLAGIELVKNRIDFTAELGGDAVVMHAYPETAYPELAQFNGLIFDQLRRTLDELQPYARERGIKIALENLIDFAGVQAGAVRAAEAVDNFDLILRVYAHYGPEYIGFCYDSGHAILGRNRMDRLAPLMERLCVLHLHDNDGQGDLHLLPFAGAVDWGLAAQLIAASPYEKPISYEVSIHNTGIGEERAFLQQAYAAGTRFAAMIGQP